MFIIKRRIALKMRDNDRRNCDYVIQMINVAGKVYFGIHLMKMLLSEN